MLLKITLIVIVPIVFYALSRFLNAQVNYYLTVIADRGHKLIKFSKLSHVSSFMLISFFCKENLVAKRVIVFSILSFICAILMSISTIIAYELSVKYLPIAFWILSFIMLTVLLVSVHFRDLSVWTFWGTRKK